MQIRTADSHSLKQVISLVDETFIFSKGRKISLARRFPDLFSETNFQNIFFITRKDMVVSTVSCKPVSLLFHSHFLKIFLIGLVATHPEHQGEGHSTILLKHIEECFIKSKRYHLGLLWTTIQPFYSRLGWRDLKSEILLSCTGLKEAIPAMSVKPLNTAKHSYVSEVEGYCQELGYTLSHPDEMLKKVIPSGLDETDIFICEDSDKPLGLVYFGIKGTTCFISMIIFKDLKTLGSLCSHIAGKYHCDQFKFNLPSNSPAEPLIARAFQHTNIEIKKLGMALPGDLSPRLDISNLYFPFHYRI